MTGHRMRTWRLEYECNGAPFRWSGQALNESAADSLARHVLAVEWSSWFDHTAILTVCIEREHLRGQLLETDGLLDTIKRVVG